MTERDYTKFKRLLYFLPLVTLIVSLLIQVGSWRANSANTETRITEQGMLFKERMDRLEREKADISIVEKVSKLETEKADMNVIDQKFENIDWKLDLIMQSMKIEYRQKVQENR